MDSWHTWMGVCVCVPGGGGALLEVCPWLHGIAEPMDTPPEVTPPGDTQNPHPLPSTPLLTLRQPCKQPPPPHVSRC